MAIHCGNKTFKRPGGLAFPQYGRCVKIAIIRVVHLPWSATHELIFLLIKDNKLNTEQSK